MPVQCSLRLRWVALGVVLTCCKSSPPARDHDCDAASCIVADATSSPVDASVIEAAPIEPSRWDAGPAPTGRRADAAVATRADADAGPGDDPEDDAGAVDEPSEPIPLETVALAAVAGPYATPPSDQAQLRVSADLGWAFVHRDRIWTLFGDSWLLDFPTDGSAPDDAMGSMSFNDFPDAVSVEAFVSAHPAPAGEPAWHAAAPPLHYVLKPGTRSDFAPLTLERDGMVVSTGTGFTPMTAFSNGRDDARAAAFTIVTRYEPRECSSGRCPDGYECDPELGRDSLRQWNPACVVGETLGCVAGPGFCLDKGSSRYDETSMGRRDSVLLQFEVGQMNEADPSRFRAQPWLTRRFSNLTARTVSDFDPARADGTGNDYRPAHGNGLTRSGVFVWGRPQFGGIGAEQRDAQLYLAWQAMPETDPSGQFDWQPRFFAGLDPDGRPRFVEREVDARPLDLDAAVSGEQPQEIHDVLAQMAITWLPELQRFVMFYGGDMSPQFLNGVFASDVDKVVHDPRGSLHVRYAKQPWGPWTAPRELLAAGDVSASAAPAGLYGPGGILAHNNCTDDSCARYEPTFRLVPGNNNGVLYGPSFVDPWTAERPGQVDLYWFVSTWNPYQVVLMKTTLATGRSVKDVHAAAVASVRTRVVHRSHHDVVTRDRDPIRE